MHNLSFRRLGSIMKDCIWGNFLVKMVAFFLTFRPHYNLNLQSIAINGQIVPIDPAVFETSRNRGTIVDSGTTLAYLAEEAYDPFLNAVSNFGAAVSCSGFIGFKIPPVLRQMELW